MRIRLFTLALFLFSMLQRPVSAGPAWHETKGKHFIVYAQEGGSFSNSVLRKAEEHYQSITRYFGNLPKSDFWSWDNRCKIYIYRSRAEYVSQTGQPEWSGGFADVNSRSIVSFQNAPDFFDSILPHEMAHLVFREFVQLNNREVPRWLDEGFAIAQETNVRTALDETVRKAVARNETLSIGRLNAMSTLHQQPTESARLFYAQAQSITRFLIEGRDGSYFLNFCRLLRDGVEFEDALRRSYRRDFGSIDDLEKSWRRHVKRH